MSLKKIFLVISLLTLLLTPAVFAQAACSWEVLTISSSFSGGATYTSGGCDASKGFSQDTSAKGCSGLTRPDTSAAFGQTSVCCCEKESGQPVSTKAPKFQIPNLQITLPGLNLTQPTCQQNGSGDYTCKVN